MQYILKIKRMFPAGGIAPQGMPYKNMEEAIKKYIDKRTSGVYNHAMIYMNMALINTKYHDQYNVVGFVIEVMQDEFAISFNDKEAYNFLSEHLDQAVVRIVSNCSTSDDEYGVKVNEVIRFEIDIIPKGEI